MLAQWLLDFKPMSGRPTHKANGRLNSPNVTNVS